MYLLSARPVPSGTRCNPGNIAPGPVTGALIFGSGAGWVWANAVAVAASHTSMSFWNMGEVYRIRVAPSAPAIRRSLRYGRCDGRRGYRTRLDSRRAERQPEAPTCRVA